MILYFTITSTTIEYIHIIFRALSSPRHCVEQLPYMCQMPSYGKSCISLFSNPWSTYKSYPIVFHVASQTDTHYIGRSLHCQVEHHMQTKFATPILHAIDNIKKYDIFSTYIFVGFHPFRFGWMNPRSWRDAPKWGASSLAWHYCQVKRCEWECEVERACVRWRLHAFAIKSWVFLPLITLLDSHVVEWEITWLVVCIWREN
jgi:hypothetical protein